MNSQQSEQSKHQQNVILVCNECGVSCKNFSSSCIGADQSTQTFIISIQNTQAYCLYCLEKRVKQEIAQARMLQERYIYHKEFQSSFQQIEMNKKNQVEQQLLQRQKLNQEIIKIKQDQAQLQKNLDSLREDSDQLKQKIYNFQVQEEKFWEGINKVERRTNKVQEKSMNTKFDKQEEKDIFDSLSRISVIHLFTDIIIDDNLALVQGMAMGRKPDNSDVSWEQVAIGLSHLLIALNFLALKYTFQYKNIEEIRIKGIQTEVILKGKKKVLSVYNTKQNEKQFGQFLQVLLVQTAFLSQYILEAESIQYSEQFRIPFLINVGQGKIAELHIDPYKVDERVRWNNWTKAMRYFLINFKHMITVYAINDKFL